MKKGPPIGHDRYQPTDDAPQWFLNSIAKPGVSIVTSVAGKSVHMLAWNWENTELPTLMFVHGFGAHANWWSFLAPFFAEHYRVVTIDMPGMGDSEAPTSYDENSFARAIIGCIESHELQPVCIVGHSYGGAQSIRAMALSPHLFSHGIVVDSNVRLPHEPLIRRLQPKGSHKISPTRADCMNRFRLVPSQPNDIQVLIQFIAFHSCRKNENGWHWKSDPDCINSAEIEDPIILRSVPTRIDMIFGENSFLNIDNKPKRVLELFPHAGKLVIIPDGGHHLMVDHPLELVSAIKALLIH